MSNDGNADADITGATGSGYTLADADGGRTIRVRVSFTDDSGNVESLTSEATPAVTRPPLTVSLDNAATAPTGHDGSTAFTFDIRFSEEFSLSYVTLRDHAITVTSGTVTNAKRLARSSNMRWEVTVLPDSDSDVRVVLPVTVDCEDEWAICTEDGRPLSNRLEITVQGPGG